MLIIVPYVSGMLQPKTARTPGAEFVELPASDPYAYWRLIKRLYEHGDDWCIIEQDIVITQEQLDALDTCTEPWCVYGYHRGGVVFAALGTLRLRREVMVAYPNLLTFDTPEHVYFDQCDGTLYGKLRNVNLKEHRHEPNVGHEQSAVRVLHEWKVCREPMAVPLGSSSVWSEANPVPWLT